MKLARTFKGFAKQINEIKDPFMTKDLHGKVKYEWLQLGRYLQWFDYSQEYYRGPYTFKKHLWPNVLPEWLLTKRHLLLMNSLSVSSIFQNKLVESIDQENKLTSFLDTFEAWPHRLLVKLLKDMGLLEKKATPNILANGQVTWNYLMIRKWEALATKTRSPHNSSLNWCFPLIFTPTITTLTPLQELYVVLIEAWLSQAWDDLMWDETGIFQIPQQSLLTLLKTFKTRYGFSTSLKWEQLQQASPDEISFESSRRTQDTAHYVTIRPPQYGVE